MASPTAKIDNRAPVSERARRVRRVREVTKAAPASVPPPAEVRVDAARPTRQARPSADDEAMQLMMKLLGKAAVARSFVKLATGIVVGNAAVAAQQLKVAAEASGLSGRLDRVKQIARAASDAAVHVATHRTTDAEPEATAGDDDAPASGHRASA